MAEHCATCDKSLTGYPKIRLDGDVYCYSCAKGVVSEQDRLAELKLAPELEEYEVQVARYKTWQQDLSAAAPAKGVQQFIIIGSAVGFALIFAEGKKAGDIVMLFIFGLLIGLLANYFYVQSKRGDWIRQNPQPNYPSRPSGNYASSRIELVGGGTRGKQISGDYRRQILERDEYRCQCCGKVFPAEELEVHHVKSRAKRGKNLSTNLVTLCFDCHLDENWFGHSHYMRKWYRKKR